MSYDDYLDTSFDVTEQIIFQLNRMRLKDDATADEIEAARREFMDNVYAHLNMNSESERRSVDTFIDTTDVDLTVIPFASFADWDREFTRTGHLYNDRLDFDDPITAEMLEGTQIDKILQSQGFEVADLQNPLFVDQQKFLKDVIIEIVNTYGDCGIFMMSGSTTLKNSIDTYFATDKAPVYVTGTMGLVNPIVGDGGLFNMNVTTPIEIKHNALVSVDTLMPNANVFGYSPQTIFNDDFEINVSKEKPKSTKLKGHQLTLALEIDD